jgi:hypothetical protein
VYRIVSSAFAGVPTRPAGLQQNRFEILLAGAYGALMTMRVFLLTFASLVFFAAQRQPQPGSPTLPNVSQGRPGAVDQTPAPVTSDQPATSATTATPSPQPVPVQPQFVIQQTNGRQDAVSSSDGWITIFTGFLVVVGALQVWVLFRQQTVMNRQTTIMNAQGLVSTTTLEVTKIIERAYVSMSHVPPGLSFIENPVGHPHDARVTIRITNSGHTPADLIAHDVRLVFGPLLTNPGRPAIPTNSPTSVMMPNDHADVWLNFPITQDQYAAALLGGPVAVVGWVVYRDRFEKRHRHGYARAYNQPAPGTLNNLMFVAESGYNYDEDLD